MLQGSVGKFWKSFKRLGEHGFGAPVIYLIEIDDLLHREVLVYRQLLVGGFHVSTPLRNISQIGNFPQIGVKMKNFWNHHLDYHHLPFTVSFLSLFSGFFICWLPCFLTIGGLHDLIYRFYLLLFVLFVLCFLLSSLVVYQVVLFMANQPNPP